MGTLFFWSIIAAVSYCVFVKVDKVAARNVSGLEKIEGKWVPTITPPKYAFSGANLLYGGAVLIAILSIYFVISFALNNTGLDVKFDIFTGFQTIRELIQK